MTRSSRSLAALLFITLATSALGQTVTTGFDEDFALSLDRAQVLENLIPGTPDHYYYRCLERQHAGALDDVPKILAAWIARHGRDARVEEIENRQALLGYASDPEATWRHLIQKLGLRFDDTQQIAGARPDLPTRLDPAILNQGELARRALVRHAGTLDGFSSDGLQGLVGADLAIDLTRSLLDRLDRADLSEVVAMVVRELDSDRSRGFGSLRIHNLLLLDQLDECAAKRPSLLADSRFIATYLTRLRPGDDTDWTSDPVEREAYLDRLETFTRRLGQSQNSLEAHVLHHRLRHDLERGQINRSRFLDYLRLPRRTLYVNEDWLKERRSGEALVEFGASFATDLPPIGNDEALVRSYFEIIFRDEESLDAYTPFVAKRWLERVLAETRILAGIGDMERWYSLLNDPIYYEQLKDRVEIEFAPTSRRYYGPDDEVLLEVDIKNVDTLLIKVYEIDALAYYATAGKEVDAAIHLDGLVPSSERSIEFKEGPFRRHRELLGMPGLGAPGVYVAELIGNGLSSRAVIRKGRLHYLERKGAAGQVLNVLDEQGILQKNAGIRLGGRDFMADADGDILVPYSTQAGRKSIVLMAGKRASLEDFQHEAESYDLEAGIHVDRESLLADRKATLVIRPQLRLNGRAISLAALEKPILTVRSVDREGVESSLELRDLKLSNDRETLQEIQVPAGLRELRVELGGQVRSLSLDRDLELKSRPARFELNLIEATELTLCPLFGRTPDGYVLDLLGLNGEPIVDRALGIHLEHRHFTDPVDVQLKTDAQGRVVLGPLENIRGLSVDGLLGGSASWQIDESRQSYPSQIQVTTRDTIHLPYQGQAARASRALFSLIETRAGVPVRDALSKLSLADGLITIAGLEAGDYDLTLVETGTRIGIAVTDGRRQGDRLVGAHRVLEASTLGSLGIAELAIEGDELLVRLRDAGSQSRVHLVATRYVPAYDIFAALKGRSAHPPTSLRIEALDSIHESGRRISDEYRYILERRFAKKFPGNMLDRPGLLLNPWAEQPTSSTIGFGGGAGGSYGGRRGGARDRRGSGNPGPSPRRPLAGYLASLEFLPEGSRILGNLAPDQEGVVRVKLAELGPGQIIHALALDDDDAAYRSLVRPETVLEPKDRRLREPLDPKLHLAQQRKVEFLDTGGTTTIEDRSASRVKVYGDLAAVFRLYQTLGAAEDLTRFAFILDWPSLGRERKNELYAEHACHELNFFIAMKDPAYFTEVVRPYLANKLEKTFIDRYLLGEDLSDQLRPWAFENLNLIERILLTRTLEGQAENGARHVRELRDLLPTDQELLGRLFATAVSADALSANLNIFGGVAMKPGQSGGFAPAEGGAPGSPQPARAPVPESDAKDGAESDEPVEEEAEELLDMEEKSKSDDLNAESENRRELRMKQVDKDFAARKEAKKIYRAPSATMRLIESDYWQRGRAQSGAGMVAVNDFWLDYARTPLGEPFRSVHFAQASTSFGEMIFALAVLDLPFKSELPLVTTEGKRALLKAGSPMLILREELREAKPAEEASPILLSQSFYRLDDPFIEVDGERRDKFVTKEFLVGVSYGCRIVLTNPSSATRKLDLLFQIPPGSLPVKNGSETRGLRVELSGYDTTTREFHFYFPSPGSFAPYPAHASLDGTFVAAAAARSMKVVREFSEVDTTSWDHVSQNGSAEQVFAHLGQANLRRLDLSRIAWRLKDRDFFSRAVTLIAARHAYDSRVWSYGIHHRDPATTREFLEHQSEFLARCGPILDSPLVTIDPVERLAYQQVEYAPLFNPRAHPFGKIREILDQDLKAQFGQLMGILGHRPKLDDDDWMSVTYYLLLQDRIDEALASFARVDPTRLETRLQYDYMRAYLDFFSSDHAIARGIAEQYRDHPIERWRDLFRNVLLQLDEAEGKAVAVVDEDDRSQKHTAAADREPNLELSVEARKIAIGYRNLSSCEIGFYEMDIEFLFSSSPFVQEGGNATAYVRPNKVMTVELPADGKSLSLDLPEDYRNSNVIVEVRAGALVRRQTYFANSLSVQMNENFGQLRVANETSGKPLPRVYVKVFARDPDGKVRFHKDGYTDLRGRFDYVSLSGPEGNRAERYAVLILSDEDGAVVQEAKAPLQ